jgi:ZIP family zinc transporter
MNWYPVFLAVITCISTLVGGFLAAKRRRHIGLLGAFAAGVLITTSLVDLLPQAFKLASAVAVPLEIVMAVTVAGFISLYVVSRLINAHVFKDGVYTEVKHPLGGLFAASELSVHSFIDGLAIGFGIAADIHIGIIIAVAVICHDFTDGLSTVAIMLNSGSTLKNAMRMLFLDAVAPVFGAIITVFILIPQSYLVFLMPFFAGGFLYLGASDLLPTAHEKNPEIQVIALCIAGVTIIFALTLVLTRVLNL